MKETMVNAERLRAWVRERKEFWRSNRADDPANCWQRMNEDASFLAAIEMMAEEVDR